MVDTDHAEEVHVKLLLRLRRIRKLDGAGDAEAGVVDDHVDVPLPVENGPDRGVHLRFVRDVRLNVCHFGIDARVSAAELIDPAAFLRENPGRVQADPAGASGHDDYLLHAFLLFSLR